MRWTVFVLTLATTISVAGLGALAGETMLRYQPWSGNGNGWSFGLGQGYGQNYGQTYGYGPGQGFRPNYAPNTFSAGHGVVCDRNRRLCYGQQGYDYYATQYYFGPSGGQGAYVNPYKNQLDYSDNYGQIFSPRSGIICDQGTRTCADERGMDAHWTGQYFGDSYEERVEDWRTRDAFRPGNGIICDNRRRRCASAQGIEPGWTKFFFGRSASTGLRIFNNNTRPYFGAEKYRPRLDDQGNQD